MLAPYITGPGVLLSRWQPFTVDPIPGEPSHVEQGSRSWRRAVLRVPLPGGGWPVPVTAALLALALLGLRVETLSELGHGGGGQC